MDKKALKLALIQKITVCEDEQVLLTISNILQHLSPQESPPANDPLLEALLKPGKTVLSSPTVSEQDIAEIQQSIDDIFGS